MLLWLTARYQTRLFLVGLLLVVPIYATVRIPDLWSGESAAALTEASLGRERADSLRHRFACEDLLIAKALQQPLFGWGAFDRSSAYFGADKANRRVDTDGAWVIFLGTRGLVGLSMWYLSLILPALTFVRRFPARLWSDPRVAGGVVSVVLLGSYMIDCLMNGFVNMIYLTLAGGLVGLDPRQLGARGARSAESAAARSRPGELGSRTSVAVAGGSRGARIMMAERYLSLGRSLQQGGQREEADSAWQQALDVLASLLEAEPNSPELRRRWCDCANDLVWLRANHPDPGRRDLTTSVTIARQMVRECPDTFVYWNTLGVVCYRAGDLVSAVAALDRATALGGGTVFDDVFLAMAHARLGDLEGARTELTRAVVRAEQAYPGHSELAVFCDEARSILRQDPGTSGAAIDGGQGEPLSR
jgi:tetratricopeptide (TPR) repeat protein